MSEISRSPIRFRPVYQTRVWGGRTLANSFGRDLPDAQPYGESWELSAREDVDTVIQGSHFPGNSLRGLWKDDTQRPQIFGPDAPDAEEFPLLCKILDAQDRLSIQVHPPAEIAPELGGEPKTEVWFIAEAEPGAELYVGFRSGTTKEQFAQALEDGTVEDFVHRIPVSSGDYIFIPSGRLHAIGAGLLIYEIQQSSDTTYRVFDWNRMGLDGQPRELHIEQSLACIDFDDFEPTMDGGAETEDALLCECPHFRLERHQLPAGESISTVTGGRFAIMTVVSGELAMEGAAFGKGDFFIQPHGAESSECPTAATDATVLLTTWGKE